MSLKIYPMSLGPVGANCYIISNNERAVIVDPGDEAGKIIHFLQGKQLKPEAILMTHAHYDHIGALTEVMEKYEIPVIAHRIEKPFYEDPQLNLSFRSGRSPISLSDFSMFQFVDSEKTLNFIDEDVQLFHVPGHSPGSLAFYFKERGIVISGDALFKGSIGRTDLPFGNMQTLLASVKDKLFTLPDTTVVYSGHGQATLIGDEKKLNPFF